MYSTRTWSYAAGWRTHSTGPLKHDVRGINLLTKGRVTAGVFVGSITADAGSIGTTELANLAVTTAKIAAGAVTDAKRSYGWSTVVNSGAGVSTKSIGVPGGYLITNTGSSLGLVLTTTGTRISIPTAGDQYRFNIDVTPGATVGVFVQSTAATFDGTNKFLKFGENDQFAVIEAASTTRWVVTSWSTGVSLAATT